MTTLSTYLILCRKELDDYSQRFRKLLATNTDLARRNAVLVEQYEISRKLKDESEHLTAALAASLNALRIEAKGQIDRLRYLNREVRSENDMLERELKKLRYELSEALAAHRLLVASEDDKLSQESFEVLVDVPPLHSERRTTPLQVSQSSSSCGSTESRAVDAKENIAPGDVPPLTKAESQTLVAPTTDDNVEFNTPLRPVLQEAPGMNPASSRPVRSHRVGSYALPKLNTKLRQGDVHTFGDPSEIPRKTTSRTQCPSSLTPSVLKDKKQ